MLPVYGNSTVFVARLSRAGRQAGNLADMAITGMLIDGVFASQAIDSSGEVLDVEGCDISSFHELKGLANWEHRGDKVEGASALDVVGKIVFAKKIFSRDDCTSERQRRFWNEVKGPLIYGIVRLYDGAGHIAAQALAAQVRDHVANGEPVLVGFSIEGSTLSRVGNRLTETVARRVAMTIKPCNKTCESGILSDPHAPAGFLANPEKASEGEIALAQETMLKKEHPLYARLGGVEMERVLQAEDDGVLRKTLTAGSTASAPDSLSGGAALQKEGLRKKRFAKKEKIDIADGVSKPEAKQLAADLHAPDLPVGQLKEGVAHEREHDSVTEGDAHQTAQIAIDHLKEDPEYYEKLKLLERKKLIDIVRAFLSEFDPTKHGEAKSFIKTMMPEATDEFLDHFSVLVDKYRVKKSERDTEHGTDLLLRVEACQVALLGLNKSENTIAGSDFLPIPGTVPLTDGVDPSKPLALNSAGAWYKSNSGPVFVCSSTYDDGEWCSALKMVDYAGLATDFFGVRQVAPVSACRTPDGRAIMSARLAIHAADPLHNVHDLNQRQQRAVLSLGTSGLLFKFLAMDLVMGLTDRPAAACAVGDSEVVLLATDRCFTQQSVEARFDRPPAYLVAVEVLAGAPPVCDQEDVRWLLSLDEDRIKAWSVQSGSLMPDRQVQRMIARLSALQLRVFANQHLSLEQIFCKKVSNEH